VVFSGFLGGAAPSMEMAISGSWDYKLSYPLLLPYKITSVPVYALTYIFMEIVSFLGKGFVVHSDLISNGIIVVLSLQFDMLAKDLENFDVKSGYDGIKKIVKRHNKLLEISDELEAIFSITNMIVTVVLLSSLVVG
jgi:hypothetical protein